MGSHLDSTCRGFVHWRGLLLAVSLLTFWCQPTTAQFSIISRTVATGQYVLMRPQQIPLHVQAFRWFRGEREQFNRYIGGYFQRRRSERGPSHNGRTRVISDGCLLIEGVSLSDSGIYTVVAYLPHKMKEIGWGRLNVYEPVRRPTLLASNFTVTENKNAVVFICNTNMVSPEWMFHGEKLQFSERMKLSQDNTVLTIDPVKREDTGAYQCMISNPISSAESWVFWLEVKHE